MVQEEATLGDLFERPQHDLTTIIYKQHAALLSNVSLHRILCLYGRSACIVGSGEVKGSITGCDFADCTVAFM